MPKSVRLRGLGVLCLLAISGVGVMSAPAGNSPQPSQASGGQPPIIDRELFFGDPEIAGAQISPDGHFLSFLKPYNGTRNIWVKKTSESFDTAHPITADTKRPISAYFWSRDGKFVLYAQDAGGDENFNVYAVNPSDPPAADTHVPAARNITDAK